MKVAEKATDRKAEVHIHVEGQVQALKEYGEYISAKDKAVCCYVPVDEGHKIRISGKFSGTTLAIAHDAVVDGVFRKTSLYTSRNVQNQKQKKIDVETFLYETDQGIIDTAILVAPLSGVTASQSEALETIGTVELRLYITRQLDVSHTIQNVEKYYFASRGKIEDKAVPTVPYKQIAPTFQMMFEKDCALLESKRSAREQRNMNSPRPGPEPWAIFRFHYRSKDAIENMKLNLTFDPLSKAKTEPRTLVLDPVPPLLAGTKPHKDDGDTSTGASSPMPPDLPFTPVKSASAPKSPTATKKQQPKPTTTMTATAEKEPTGFPENTPSPESDKDVSEDLRARLFPKSSSKPPAKESLAPTTDKPIDKPIDKEQSTGNDSIAIVAPKGKRVGSTEDSAAKASSLTHAGTKPPNTTAAKTTGPTKDTVKKASQAPSTPVKEQAVRPTPIVTPASIAQKQTTAPTTPVTPTKRPAAFTEPESKRTNIVTTPKIPSTPLTVSRVPPGSPSPKPMSVERQLAEQRKKVEDLRRKRLEIAKKQSVVDKQMEPYKERMAEELERLNQEMMEEENAYTEEEQHYSASIEMLTEFKKVDGGD